MGRDPKSAVLKILTNNPSHRKIKVGPASQLADPLTKPPAHLTREAKAIWKDKIVQLVADKTLAAGDLDILARYCEAIATEREAARQIEARGFVLSNEQCDYQNPWVKIRTDAATRSAKAAAILGIGQLNRQKLTPIETGKQDESSIEAFNRKYG